MTPTVTTFTCFCALIETLHIVVPWYKKYFSSKWRNLDSGSHSSNSFSAPPSKLFTFSPRLSDSLHISFSFSWWQLVYPLLIFWLGSLPALLSPHFPWPTSTKSSWDTHICRCSTLSVCVLWDKSCNNLECLVRCVCVCLTQWDIKREAKWVSTHRKRRAPIFRPYKSLFPASSCTYRGINNTLQSFRHSVAGM